MNTDIRIFVSYRRADSPCFAERIRDWFMLAYQRENVFMDFDAIPPFVDFEVFIVEQIAKVDVMLVIIGPRWLEMLNERMKTDELDYVRMEIRQAIQMGKLVAPIVVDGARTPRSDELPEDIRPMMRANIPRLDSGRQFLDNIERIISALPKALDQHARIKAANDIEADRMVDPIEAITFVPFSFPKRTTPSSESVPNEISRSQTAPHLMPPPPPPAPKPMLEVDIEKPTITLYSTIDDEAFAHQLQADLALLPVNIQVNQPPNDSVLGIVILTPDSRNSDAIQGEIAELQKYEIPILPLLVAGDIGSSVPYAIAANQVIDMRDYDKGLETFMSAVKPYL
jgi:hypothetical protein